jgi:hypothetical protein
MEDPGEGWDLIIDNADGSGSGADSESVSVFLFKKPTGNITSFFKRAREEMDGDDDVTNTTNGDMGDGSDVSSTASSNHYTNEASMYGDGGYKDEQADDDDEGVGDEEVFVCFDAGPANVWALKYYISQKVVDTKRVSKVWNYFADVCINQHSKIENLNNMKICLACISKRRNKIVSMGGGNKKSSTSANLINHLKHVHLGDGQYKAYLDIKKA